MNAQTHSNDVNAMYRLTLIEPTSPPEGMPEGDWCRYDVEYGDSKMNCIRAGTLKEVTQHAEAFVEELNLRSSKGYSAYAQRAKKK